MLLALELGNGQPELGYRGGVPGARKDHMQPTLGSKDWEIIPKALSTCDLYGLEVG